MEAQEQDQEQDVQQKDYTPLLMWLNYTLVGVHESVRVDSKQDSRIFVTLDATGSSPKKQPIRNLFIALGIFFRLIVKFINYRRIKGQKETSATVSLMYTINNDMKEVFKKRPKKTSVNYNSFKEDWEKKISVFKWNDFLDQFLGTLFNLDTFDVNTLENFILLCSEIGNLDDSVLEQLYETYPNSKYNKLYETETKIQESKGGRKLSRRRKSNSKSKLKYNKRRRSYKKSSHRRQRH